MSTSPLLVKLRTAFADCHEVESDTYRCVLKYRGKPRGIYSFRFVWRLPDQAELAQLNERVISPSYFSAHDAVRWNLYLVLVAESAVDLKDFYERKRVIEGDRRYARKVVLQRAELDSFLERRTPQPSQEALGQSILDVWRTRLEAAGLGDIAADVPRAKVIRSIRSGELIKGVSMSTS